MPERKIFVGHGLDRLSSTFLLIDIVTVYVELKIIFPNNVILLDCNRKFMGPYDTSDGLISINLCPQILSLGQCHQVFSLIHNFVTQV